MAWRFPAATGANAKPSWSGQCYARATRPCTRFARSLAPDRAAARASRGVAHRRHRLGREEDAVCVLQALLGDALPGVGRARVLADMDHWATPSGWVRRRPTSITMPTAPGNGCRARPADAGRRVCSNLPSAPQTLPRSAVETGPPPPPQQPRRRYRDAPRRPPTPAVHRPRPQANPAPGVRPRLARLRTQPLAFGLPRVLREPYRRCSA